MTVQGPAAAPPMMHLVAAAGAPAGDTLFYQSDPALCPALVSTLTLEALARKLVGSSDA